MTLLYGILNECAKTTAIMLSLGMPAAGECNSALTMCGDSGMSSNHVACVTPGYGHLRDEIVGTLGL